jgi:hypothetical protein
MDAATRQFQRFGGPDKGFAQHRFQKIAIEGSFAKFQLLEKLP